MMKSATALAQTSQPDATCSLVQHHRNCHQASSAGQLAGTLGLMCHIRTVLPQAVAGSQEAPHDPQGSTWGIHPQYWAGDCSPDLGMCQNLVHQACHRGCFLGLEGPVRLDPLRHAGAQPELTWRAEACLMRRPARVVYASGEVSASESSCKLSSCSSGKVRGTGAARGACRAGIGVGLSGLSARSRPVEPAGKMRPTFTSAVAREKAHGMDLGLQPMIQRGF